MIKLTPVSIPYRYDTNVITREYRLFYEVFQFLIGTIQTLTIGMTEEELQKFQFLIGTIQTGKGQHISKMV